MEGEIINDLVTFLRAIMALAAVVTAVIVIGLEYVFYLKKIKEQYKYDRYIFGGIVTVTLVVLATAFGFFFSSFG